MALFSNRIPLLKKLRQYLPAFGVLFLPSLMPDKVKDKDAEAFSNVKMEAAISYAQTNYGINTLNEKDLEAVEEAENSQELIASLTKNHGAPLTADQSYARLDSATKAELFTEAYKEVRKDALPVKVGKKGSPNITLAPIIGDSYDDFYIYSHYGYRHEYGRMHWGVDIHPYDENGRRMDSDQRVGKPLKAVLPGQVTKVQQPSAWKLGSVSFKQGDYEGTYYHLKPGYEDGSQIKVGDFLEPSQQIGKMGDRDYKSTGAHVHLELKYKGQHVNLNEMIKKGGFLGELRPTQLGIEIGKYNVEKLEKDSTGVDFNEVPDQLYKEFNTFGRHVINFMMNDLEGGKTYKDRTKYGVAQHSHPGINVRRLSAEGAYKIHKKEAYDVALRDKKESEMTIAEKQWLVAEMDVRTQYGNRGARKLIAGANGDWRKLNALRLEKVKGKSSERGLRNRLIKLENYIEDVPNIVAQINSDKKKDLNNPTYKEHLRRHNVVAKLVEKEKKKRFASQFSNNKKNAIAAMNRVDQHHWSKENDFSKTGTELAQATPKPAPEKFVYNSTDVAVVEPIHTSAVAPVEVFMAAQRSILAEARQKGNLSGKAVPKEVVVEQPVQQRSVPSKTAPQFADTRNTIFADSRKPIAGFGPPQKPQWDHKRAYTYA